MIDLYVLATPILMLGILALLGFVGCDVVWGLDEVPPRLPPVVGLTASAGDGKISLFWDSYSGAVEFYVKRGVTSGNYIDSHTVLPAELPYTDFSVMPGTTYYYVVSAKAQGGETSNSNEVSAISFSSFVTTMNLGTLRNNFDGWVGMVIQVDVRPLTIVTLGRIVAPGNSNTHIVKIVDASTGVDVAGASTIVNLNGGTPGQFVYAGLPSSITLDSNASYYVLSQEILADDQFYDFDSTVETKGEASVTRAVYSEAITPATYNQISAAGHSYGFVDFQYY